MNYPAGVTGADPHFYPADDPECPCGVLLEDDCPKCTEDDE